MTRRVQRRDTKTVIGIDTQLHIARGQRVTLEQVPPAFAVDLDAGHCRQPAGPLDLADVADLTTTARMERRSRQHDRTRPGVEHDRLVQIEIGLFMTEIDGHE
jgi:hypothetical protein